MNERVIISWNIPNWITVVLMVVLAYLLVSLVTQFVRARMGSGGSSPPGSGAIARFMGVFGTSLAPAG